MRNLKEDHDVYLEHLETINGIHFTRREMDIIACMTAGRSAKRTATILSISPKTIENYTRNIMLKLECNSREKIVDFIEKSPQFSKVKHYYLSLLLKNSFEHTLKEITVLTHKDAPKCLIVHWQGEKTQRLFVDQLKKDLEASGVSASIETRERPQSLKQIFQENDDGTYKLYILPKTGVVCTLEKEENQQCTHLTNHQLFLFQNNEEPQEIRNFSAIYLTAQENYYFLFFEILNKLLSQNKTLEKISGVFKEQYNRMVGAAIIQYPQDHVGTGLSQKSFFNHSVDYILVKKKWALALMSIMGFLITGFLILSNNQDYVHTHVKQETSPIRSSLNIPSETILIKRPNLTAKIDEHLKESQGIKTVGLIGIGGAGKTTLARQYALSQKSHVIWEINAETNQSLFDSFEKLASALAQTEEEKKTLRSLQDIKNSQEKEAQIIHFVQARLKEYPNWFLIYDNVENFSDLHHYFPRDSKTWGQGKIILTTRNSTFQTSGYAFISLGELNQEEKFSLFKAIVTQGEKGSFTETHKTEANRFLDQVPSFPLDISTAAYYLKITNTSYEEYLQYLHENSEDFGITQINLLKETGEYTKTRYGIIILSLKKLIETHKDFAGLLLFIGLLDSQNIPKDLLTYFKGKAVVDNFIFNLKKYSLITSETPLSSHSISTFSIHRSTQKIILSYLKNFLDLEKKDVSIQAVADTLENYISSFFRQ